jgi:hypothetical protein
VLSHFIEKQGIPTAGISLVRLHTELIRPPRSLWVPFEFGRPLGAPDDAAFQKKVLLNLLTLFEAPNGPVLEDFLEDVPIRDVPERDAFMGDGGAIVMSCPVSFGEEGMEDMQEGGIKQAFLREIGSIRPWYNMAVAKRGRTTMGASNLEPEKLCDFIYAFIQGIEPENPRDDVGIAYTLKLAVEDLKAYYLEGVTAQPGQGHVSSQAVKDWFWDKTVAGKVLLELMETCAKSTDKTMSLIGGRFIVPGDVVQRKRKG